MNYLINLKNKPTLPHSHKNYEIIICTKGRGRLLTANNDIELIPGKIIIIPPTIEHWSSNSDEYERIYIMGKLDQHFSFISPKVIYDTKSLEGLSLAKIIYKNRFCRDEYLTSLISAFVHFLLKNTTTENNVSFAINEIIDKIVTDFYNPNIDLANILKQSGYSEDYIRDQFKKKMLQTPTEFLTRTRIAHACWLIEVYRDSLSLSEVAEKCGYLDYIYFSRKFKQILGVSPKNYIEVK